jgi:hypothetical protein
MRDAVADRDAEIVALAELAVDVHGGALPAVRALRERRDDDAAGDRATAIIDYLVEQEVETA